MSAKTHKYRLGQRVNYTSAGTRRQFSSARFTITRLLPPVGNTVSYRIKGDDELHERVVEETQVEALF